MQNIPVKRIKANGIQFAYLEAGEGPLVVCLHGFPDTAWSFVPLMQILADAGYRVVAPFMRGYFPSARSEEGDYSVLGLARDLLAIVDALALADEKAIVIGHDWGGFAAYTAANLAPEKFSALVQMSVPHMAVSNFTLAQVRRSWYVWLFQLPQIGNKWGPETWVAKDDFAFIDRLYEEWSPNWFCPPEHKAEVKKALAAPGGLHAALAYYRAMIMGMRLSQLRLMQKKTAVPALVVAGEADESIGIDQYKGIAAAYTGFFRFISYPKVGHFPHAENTSQLGADILEFLHQCRL